MAKMRFPNWWAGGGRTPNSISNLSYNSNLAYNPNLLSSWVTDLSFKNLWEIEKDIVLWAIIWVSLNTFEKSMKDEFEKVKNETGSLSIRHIRWITRSLNIDDIDDFSITIADMIDFLKNPFISASKLSMINLSSNNVYSWMVNNWNNTLSWIKKLQNEDSTVYISIDDNSIAIDWRWYNKTFIEKKWNTFFQTSKEWGFFVKTSLIDMTRLNMINRAMNILTEIQNNWQNEFKINKESFHKVLVPKAINQWMINNDDLSRPLPF